VRHSSARPLAYRVEPSVLVIQWGKAQMPPLETASLAWAPAHIWNVSSDNSNSTNVQKFVGGLWEVGGMAVAVGGLERGKP